MTCTYLYHVSHESLSTKYIASLYGSPIYLSFFFCRRYLAANGAIMRTSILGVLNFNGIFL